MGSTGYSVTVQVILPIDLSVGILLSSTFSKTSLYFSLPLLLVVLLIAIFYVCIVCPLKERNAKDFSYKECVKRSLSYLVFERWLFLRVTAPLAVIAILGIPLQLILFTVISAIIIILLISIAMSIWEFFHHE